MLAIADAEHAETAPGAAQLVITRLVCSLVGTTETIRLLPGSIAARVYGDTQSQEQFACNYGLNPDYRAALFQGDLKATGFGPDGEVRLLELAGREFFVATLFLPQVASTAQHPHPLLLAFLSAAGKG